ncbi:hypothetical protein [Spongiactinospora sp. TRM90649]|uniref:hypothetical protein n=1 Tax=Spongiactinospora sp. TRM90649 TaxID=3031114 RepID=UPI0023F80092|nr:hypothetical protein [Spongiactinospora sp. TRM90649]MDF5755167.1 hypothetical protein [Spongiactinospora sp. TRM90649]
MGSASSTPAVRRCSFDRAHVKAVRDGRELPVWPQGTREHPGDLLDEQDVTYGAVRHDRAVGRLPSWAEVCGAAHIKRDTLDHVIAAAQSRLQDGAGQVERTFGMERPDFASYQTLWLTPLASCAARSPQVQQQRGQDQIESAVVSR